MIEFESHPHGVVLTVRARPSARRSEIRGQQDGALKVAVTQAPEKGKANKAILELLAKQLGLRKSQVELLSGETSPTKRVLIRDATARDLGERLAALMPEP